MSLIKQHILDSFQRDGSAHKSGRANNAFSGLVLVDSDGVQHYHALGSGFCHGMFQKWRIRDALGVTDKKLVAVLTQVQELLVEKEKAKDYIKWLVTSSPWHSVFIEKDVIRIIEWGWVLDPSAPANLLGSACIATRWLTETYNPEVVKRFPVYTELLQASFSETESFLFANLFAPQTSSLYPLSVAPLTTDHAVFSWPRMTQNDVKRFLEHQPINIQPPFQKTGGVEGQICALWSYNNDSIYSNFVDLVRQIKPVAYNTRPSLDIFKKVQDSVVLLQNREQLHSVVNQIKEWVYEGC